ncbi:outer membrane protein assembly factor [Saprospira grandis]|uniref:outer membrane protein assembly factor n=1 Tax=Saprospira grandis TaxID=1008 RepID=UPI0022DE80CE|nr:BamA/TamA family outer membrane protein [Saprospira grandis]WBM73471.1 outer membrane protein assembly factor [Saprospira grandis]
MAPFLRSWPLGLLFPLLLLLALGQHSCQNRKYLRAHSNPKHKKRRVYEEQLLVSNTIKLNKKKNKDRADGALLCADSILVPQQSYELSAEQQELFAYELFYTLRQKPNRKILFSYPFLWIHNRAKEKRIKYVYDRNYRHLDENGQWKKGGIRPDSLNFVQTTDSSYFKDNRWRKFLRNKVGEAPSIFDSAEAKYAALSMQNYLIQQGYLDAKVGYQVEYNRYKAKVNYYYSTGRPLLIDTVIFESKDPQIHKILQQTKYKSKLKAGNPLAKSAFLEEKTRLTYEIRNQGYQEFNWNYIAFEADTVNADTLDFKGRPSKSPRANIYVNVLPPSDSSLHQQYSIHNVFIVLDEPRLEIHKSSRSYQMDSSYVVLRPPNKGHRQLYRSELYEGDSLNYWTLFGQGEENLLARISNQKNRSILVLAGGKFPYLLRLSLKEKAPKNAEWGKIEQIARNEIKISFPKKENKKSFYQNRIKQQFYAENPLNGKIYKLSFHPYRQRFIRKSYQEVQEISPTDIHIHTVLRKPAKTAETDSIKMAKDIAKRKKQNFIIKDAAISRNVQLTNGSIYNFDAGKESIDRISDLNVFNFPRLEYVPSKSGQANELDAYVFMQKAPKLQLGVDTEVNTGSNNLGAAVNLSARNRNIFRGGESFAFNVESGIDFQIRNRDSVLNSTEGFLSWVNLLDISTGFELKFPRMLGFRNWTLGVDKPNSKINLNYNYLQQASDFRISSFDASFSYNWQKGKHQSFSWSPLQVNLTLEPQLDATFSERLAESNLGLWLSLQERYFIPASNFQYSRSNIRIAKNQLGYFRALLEITGSSVWLLDQINGNNDIQFFGIPYTQYSKVDLDLGHNWRIAKKYSLASRLMLGAALPYANSNRVPFSRQFYLGGPSSMRGWNMRYLGPGRIRAEPGAEFQLGDIRLEMNTEFRFMLNSWIGGALFADAGNVWLMKGIERDFAGYPYSPAENGAIGWDFWQELALDAGIGIRLDMSFFILRLDLAMQVRNPAGFDVTDENGQIQRYGADGLPVYWNWGRLNWVLAVGQPF